MFCPNCAATIDGSKFCRSCGSNVSLVPQAMSGQLPQSESGGDERHWRRHHRDRHRARKEPSIERATTNIFSGIGFLLAATFIILFSPPGIWWGWVFIFPAFALLGSGVGQYLQVKEQQRLRTSVNPPGAPPIAHQAPDQAPKLSAPTTSELVKPSSVTEHTTRNLESSRAAGGNREEKHDQ
ncbi:MAG TPA: zinc ribbon domain-containing protein [Blastocatellia bacterium]|nr:zinc ribbon domain-containing protein [Blastocatellia bacterium]